MHIRQRAAGAVLALGLAVGGLSATAFPATAADLSCSARLVTGSAGHKGASVTCTGGAFTAYVDCERTDNGYQYRHFGNRAVSGGTSTVWCDLNARVIHVDAVPS
ncbi:hypothetical protein SLA_3996 [Streptomyces laurentii]|uniref:Secreted protein n=2 Tax=Streptomyces laurentii TaxID=39478 RepID=A0A160P2E4_STRLU|nr:hypothetical protein SLA_3996 [Streptomyces laurentii]